MAPTKASQSSRSPSPSSPTDLPENLVKAVQTQLDLISSFRAWLDRHNLTGCSQSSSSEVNALLTSVVDQYKSRIDNLKSKFHEPIQQPNKEDQVQEVTVSENAWKLQVHQKKGAPEKPAFLIVIGNHSPIEVNLETQAELESLMGDKYLGYITKVFHAFEQSERDLIQLFMISREIEEESAKLSQPPEVTVQQHIDLLKEYNDMKDIGQQLIGLIAENKGLSIGALYEDGQYGVTADD